MIKRLRALRLRGEDGYSLIEMITVMLIMSVVFAGITAVFVAGSKAQAEQDRRFQAQVTTRLALDKIRRDKRSPIDVVENLSELTIVEERVSVRETVSANQEYDLLLKAIDRLPARCREVVVLRKLQGLSPGETAHRLGISEETVHVQARKGLERVQSFLRKQGLIRNTVHDS